MKAKANSGEQTASADVIVSEFMPKEAGFEQVLEGKIVYGGSKGRIERREMIVQIHSISSLFDSLRAVAKG